MGNGSWLNTHRQLIEPLRPIKKSYKRNTGSGRDEPNREINYSIYQSKEYTRNLKQIIVPIS